jgi:hypothetical protein
METTEVAPANNQSIEKGIYLTGYNKRVHACKVREDIGAGITRCGVKFLIGSNQFIEEATFGAPAKENSTSKFVTCEKCESSQEYNSKWWRDWKGVVIRTLKATGRYTIA